MSAHDGRIYRVFFPRRSDGEMCQMHGIPVDMFRLNKWFPDFDTRLFTDFNLESVILRKADGREIRITMDSMFLK